jgi:hypothetical protein
MCLHGPDVQQQVAEPSTEQQHDVAPPAVGADSTPSVPNRTEGPSDTQTDRRPTGAGDDQ